MHHTLRIALGLFVLLALPALALRSPPPNDPDDPHARLERMAREQDPDTLGVGRTLDDLLITPLAGEPRRLSALLAGKKGAVLVMTSTGCPISRKYAPRLGTLERAHTPRGIVFIYINAVAAETPDEMRTHARESGMRGPYVNDRSLTLAQALQARTTSEAFVIDASRRLIYRGAIDDQYAIGATLDRPRRTFLNDALVALETGKPPAIGATWAPGCLLDLPEPARPQPAPADTPTYYGQVAAILAQRCTDCHRAGGTGPFGLETPAHIQGRASMMQAVIRDGLMPPTHGVEPGDGHTFAALRHLPDDERRTLLAWLRAGRPLGDPAPTPALAPLPQTWRIGMPDILLRTQPVTLPADGPLVHTRRILPLGIDTETWIDAIEMRPTDRGTIEHALVWLLAPGQPLPAPDTMPPSRTMLAAYSVSDSLVQWPAGAGVRLPAGAFVVVDFYSRPMGKAMPASLRIAMRPLPTPPMSEVNFTSIVAPPFECLPGDPSTAVDASLTLDQPAQIIAIRPSMRWRGRALTLHAHTPAGGVQPLLAAPHYDTRWQIRYAFAQPQTLPAGTRLAARGIFDNSEANPANPAPNARVTSGPGASDETMLVVIETLSARTE
ncbi:MAG: redoxin family protein [Phycisphaeraceae bacterium]|nr:redoxin family protein [Phycisphaeraceae bacterium]